jgi:hypothetical protein
MKENATICNIVIWVLARNTKHYTTIHKINLNIYELLNWIHVIFQNLYMLLHYNRNFLHELEFSDVSKYTLTYLFLSTEPETHESYYQLIITKQFALQEIKLLRMSRDILADVSCTIIT